MKITKKMYNEIIYLYPKWKELNEKIKEIYPRGINLHEAFTEIVVCYHLNLKLNINSKMGSADAINYQNGKKYQIKGSSDCENDLSSFSPNSQFDTLVYCCIKKNNKYQMNIYEINNPKTLYKLLELKVNQKQNFGEQQKEKRRPRFSIFKKIIKPKNIKPTLQINLKKSL